MVPLSTAFDTPTIDRRLGLVSVAREAFDLRLWCDKQSANYGNWSKANACHIVSNQHD